MFEIREDFVGSNKGYRENVVGCKEEGETPEYVGSREDT